MGSATTMQADLFGAGQPALTEGAPTERVWLDGDSWVDVTPGWLAGADELCQLLVPSVPWRQGRRRMYDRMVDDPRLSCRYGPTATAPHPVLETAREALSIRYRVPLGAVGLNFYRDGADSVAFHRDRELRDRDDTVVAVLTLGARRPFRLRPLGGGPSRLLLPASGDLVVMGGACQRRWEHSVPKTDCAQARISVSWRGFRVRDAEGSLPPRP